MLEQNQNGSHTECWNRIKMAAILNVGTNQNGSHTECWNRIKMAAILNVGTESKWQPY